MALKKVILHGGTRDGEVREVESWQKSIYAVRKLTFAEAEDLIIDDVKCWRHPDDVYERNESGEFYYTKTIHYKPEHYAKSINQEG